MPGVVALVEGAALLALFGLAPWFSWQGSYTGDQHMSPALNRLIVAMVRLHTYSGWATAQGVSMGLLISTYSVVGVSLWLVPLAAVVLLVFGGLRVLGRVSARRASVALLACSALALLAEGIWYVLMRGVVGMVTWGLASAGAAWGFWCAAGVSAVALAAGIMLLQPVWLRARAAWCRGWHAAPAES